MPKCREFCECDAGGCDISSCGFYCSCKNGNCITGGSPQSEYRCSRLDNLQFNDNKGPCYFYSVNRCTLPVPDGQCYGEFFILGGGVRNSVVDLPPSVNKVTINRLELNSTIYVCKGTEVVIEDDYCNGDTCTVVKDDCTAEFPSTDDNLPDVPPSGGSPVLPPSGKSPVLPPSDGSPGLLKKAPKAPKVKKSGKAEKKAKA